MTISRARDLIYTAVAFAIGILTVIVAVNLVEAML